MKKEYKNQKKIFEELMGEISKLAEITTKRMFGYESFFTQAKCFAGVRNLGNATSVVLKLSSKDYSETIKESLFPPFRNTKDWVECKATSPRDVIKLMAWIELSYACAHKVGDRRGNS